jgi:hypothetical protein
MLTVKLLQVTVIEGREGRGAGCESQSWDGQTGVGGPSGPRLRQEEY